MTKKQVARLALRFGGVWLGLFAFYLWLIGKAQLEQLVAATLIGLAAAACLLLPVGRAQFRVALQWRWFLILLRRLPGQALRDTGTLAWQLWRSLFAPERATGAHREIPFAAGGRDPRSCGRRALVVSGLSLPPNTIALWAGPGVDSILVHQLVYRAESPKSREWPL